MRIVYASRTGNVRRFVDKLDFAALALKPELRVDESFVLITYTTGFGQVPEEVHSFLEVNGEQLIGVAASGNRNWGAYFAYSADRIAQAYQVPILAKFELSGTENDVQRFAERVEALETY